MFFARPRPHPTEFYGKFECETICRRRNLWRGSTLSTGQRCTHSINSELILLLLWVRHFSCTIVPRAWLFTCWRIPLCLSTLEMRLGWVGCMPIKMLKCWFPQIASGTGIAACQRCLGKHEPFIKRWTNLSISPSAFSALIVWTIEHFWTIQNQTNKGWLKN